MTSLLVSRACLESRQRGAWSHVVMLLSLHIVKVEPRHYGAHVMDGREELGTFDTISIGTAILEAAGHSLPDLSGCHVWYEHVCAGTTSTSTCGSTPRAWRMG